MNRAVLLLLLLNFAAIGALPAVFFESHGGFNRMWWLTAAPFFLCPVFLIASYIGTLSPFTSGQSFLRDLSELAAVCFSALSLALLGFTLGSHRIPIALWHQESDTPRQIVTYGAYRRIRHPFYASFLLAFVGVFLFAPHLATASTLVYACVMLNSTAAKEESRLRSSVFGSEYETYMHATGRF